jgi:biotin carboxylase/acetyl-CoA carboxylase carboxyltransferase component/biotin carboxyl carrier protein
MVRILIANRGLSAYKFILSVINWKQDDDYIPVTIVGIVTPADIDSGFKYIELLDEQIHFNDQEVYTNSDEMIKTCLEYKIDAVWPGWGYLSENADFVAGLEQNNIIFIGPTSKSMNAVSNKISCLTLGEKLGVPVTPWSGSKMLTDIEECNKHAEKIGYPLMMKAANSGGGKGIRMVKDSFQLETAWKEVQCEVKDAEIFLMKNISHCSHLEIQILGDGEHCINLSGRDCTTQRRNQKLLEETPITIISKENREELERNAVNIMKEIKYKNAGTVEFLYDHESQNFYLLEINSRLQVEHIISEELYGINLIKCQILIALGKSLQDIRYLFSNTISKNFTIGNDEYELVPPKNKHVLSVRLNAENPYENFTPSQGKIYSIEIPQLKNVWGYFSLNHGKITQYTDNQFGHVYVTGKDRKTCCNLMLAYLNQLHIKGTVITTSGFLKKYLQDNNFINQKHYTRYVSEINIPKPIEEIKDQYVGLFGCLLQAYEQHLETLKVNQKLINNGHIITNDNIWVDSSLIFNDVLYKFKFCFKSNEVLIKHQNKLHTVSFIKNDHRFYIKILSRTYIVQKNHQNHHRIEIAVNSRKHYLELPINDDAIYSPVNGIVKELNYNNQDYVNVNDVFIKIESMKMLTSFTAKKSGLILYHCKVGDLISTSNLLAEIKSENENKQYVVFTSNLYLEETTVQDTTPIKSLCLTSKPINLSIQDYPSYFNPQKYEVLFESKGMISWKILLTSNITIILTGNNINYQVGSFGVEESEVFYQSLQYARKTKYPFVYIANNSGARITINEKLKNKCININGELYIRKEDYKEFENEIVVELYQSFDDYIKILHIRNSGVENLDACAKLVCEMSKANKEILTITYVTGRTVGVGAYLARLSSRIIQRIDSPLILTGFSSINEVLGLHLYSSNLQLGGPDIMSNNGISQLLVNSDKEAVNSIQLWLSYKISSTISDQLPNNIQPISNVYDHTIYDVITNIVDSESFMETMTNWAKSVVTGRAKINGKSYCIIAANHNSNTKFIPVDPGNLESKNEIITQAGCVWYPNSAYKTAKSINDANVEGLPLLILANWRGFSGGTKDMYDNVLDFGSMIVRSIEEYKQPITIYVVPGGQLRGGAMVVLSKSLNPEKIRIFSSSTAKINVLEAKACKELKYKNKGDVSDSDALKYVELHDTPYSSILDGILELHELKIVL